LESVVSTPAVSAEVQPPVVQAIITLETATLVEQRGAATGMGSLLVGRDPTDELRKFRGGSLLLAHEGIEHLRQVPVAPSGASPGAVVMHRFETDEGVVEVSAADLQSGNYPDSVRRLLWVAEGPGRAHKLIPDAPQDAGPEGWRPGERHSPGDANQSAWDAVDHTRDIDLRNANRRMMDLTGRLQSDDLPVDPNALVQWVIRQSYIEQTQDLLHFAGKVKHFNKLKQAYRARLAFLRRVHADAVANGTPVDPNDADKGKRLGKHVVEAYPYGNPATGEIVLPYAGQGAGSGGVPGGWSATPPPASPPQPGPQARPGGPAPAATGPAPELPLPPGRIVPATAPALTVSQQQRLQAVRDMSADMSTKVGERPYPKADLRGPDPAEVRLVMQLDPQIQAQLDEHELTRVMQVLAAAAWAKQERGVAASFLPEISLAAIQARAKAIVETADPRVLQRLAQRGPIPEVQARWPVATKYYQSNGTYVLRMPDGSGFQMNVSERPTVPTLRIPAPGQLAEGSFADLLRTIEGDKTRHKDKTDKLVQDFNAAAAKAANAPTGSVWDGRAFQVGSIVGHSAAMTDGRTPPEHHSAPMTEGRAPREEHHSAPMTDGRAGQSGGSGAAGHSTGAPVGTGPTGEDPGIAGAQAIENTVQLDAYMKTLDEKLSTVGDDAQLANVDLQNVLQKQQQYMQMISNISKQLHDSAMSVIRKIGG
jgi:hypothetical protein